MTKLIDFITGRIFTTFEILYTHSVVLQPTNGQIFTTKPDPFVASAPGASPPTAMAPRVDNGYTACHVAPLQVLASTHDLQPRKMVSSTAKNPP